MSNNNESIKMTNCNLFDMEKCIENGLKQGNPVEIKKPSGDLNKAMAVLDEITLNVIQKELATSEPDAAWHKSYEKAAHDIKERIDYRHNVLHQPAMTDIPIVSNNNK